MAISFILSGMTLSKALWTPKEQNADSGASSEEVKSRSTK